MRRLLPMLAVLCLAGPATACINDSELPGHEREFRSNYNKPPAPPESAEPSNLPYAGGLVAGGTGVLLLAGAVTFAWRGPTRRG